MNEGKALEPFFGVGLGVLFAIIVVVSRVRTEIGGLGVDFCKWSGSDVLFSGFLNKIIGYH